MQKSSSIDTLHLSQDIITILRVAKIATIEQLINLSATDLILIPGIAHRRLTKILAARATVKTDT